MHNNGKDDKLCFQVSFVFWQIQYKYSRALGLWIFQLVPSTLDKAICFFDRDFGEGLKNSETFATRKARIPIGKANNIRDLKPICILVWKADGFNYRYYIFNLFALFIWKNVMLQKWHKTTQLNKKNFKASWLITHWKTHPRDGIKLYYTLHKVTVYNGFDSTGPVEHMRKVVICPLHLFFADSLTLF